MDFFGIGNTIKCLVRVYVEGSRASGRTEHLIKNLKSGDVVCFTNIAEAKRVTSLCRELGIEIKTIVMPAWNPHEIENKDVYKGLNGGSFIFDHTWVEEYYSNVIDEACKNIDYFQTNLPGFKQREKIVIKEKEFPRIKDGWRV